MKIQHRFQAVLLVLLVGIGLAANGCSESSKTPVTPPVVPTEQPDLESADGGYAPTAEAPGFGDSALLRSVSEEAEVSDALGRDPGVRELMSNPGARIYALTILWGALQSADSTGGAGDGSAYDWPGQVTLERGAVLLNSVISFERADGDSVGTRTLRTVLSWDTHTDLGFDGVRLLVVGGTGLGNPGGRDSLTITVGSFSKSYVLSDLESLQVLTEVDANGNNISLHSFAIDPTAGSVRGFLRGHWDAPAAGDSVGQFAGLWVGERGHLTGYYRGIWGTRRDGKKVFVGKVTDEFGQYRGIIRGSWDKRDNAPGPFQVELGRFAGEWTDEHGQPGGAVRGHWRAPADRSGFMEGHWCTGCDADPLGNGSGI